jgi:predicted Zn-dependent protease
MLQPNGLWTLVVILAFPLISCAATYVEPVGADGQAFRPEQDEQELWRRAEVLERRIDTSKFLYTNPHALAYLNDLAQTLAAGQVAEPSLAIRVKILRQPQLNAFALPHGTIYINTGLLARMENEAQLATVLGHELTHFTHRHALKETRNAKNKAVFHESVASLFVLVGVPPGVGQLWTLASVQGYSREMEAEADEVGLEAIVQAGYDPNESVKVFRLFQQDLSDLGIDEPYFFGSHPKLQERIDHYTALLSSTYARQSRVGGRTNEQTFHSNMDDVVLDDAAMAFEQGRVKLSRAAIQDVLSRRPENARAYYLLGEAHRRSGPSETDMREALTAYQRAAQLDDSYAEPHRELGLLFRRLDDRASAQAAFERYLALQPDSVDAPIIRKYLRDLQTQP